MDSTKGQGLSKFDLRFAVRADNGWFGHFRFHDLVRARLNKSSNEAHRENNPYLIVLYKYYSYSGHLSQITAPICQMKNSSLSSPPRYVLEVLTIGTRVKNPDEPSIHCIADNS